MLDEQQDTNNATNTFYFNETQQAVIIELTDVVQHRRSSERHPNMNSEHESNHYG